MKWLRGRERGKDPNAVRLVRDGKMNQVPEKLFEKFLGLPLQDSTILHLIALEEGSLTSIPKQHLTAENLTRLDKLNRSPLTFLRTRLDVVPWETFSVRNWLPHWEFLDSLQSEEMRVTRGLSWGLIRFLNEVEGLKKLKAIPGIDSTKEEQTYSES